MALWSARTPSASAEITGCPTNRTFVADSNCAALLPDLTNELAFTPPDAVASVTQMPSAGTTLGLGEQSILFTVTDTNSSVYYCTGVVTVVDTTAPVMTGVVTKTEECASAWAFDAPVAADACGTNTLMELSTVTNLGCGAAFTAARVWQAVDAFGNSATFTQTVAVVDTTAPTLVMPSDFSVECGNPWDFGTPSATDACRFSTVVYDNSVNDLLTRFDPGTNEVGNEIILADAARYLTEFSFEFWSTNESGASTLAGTNVTVRLRFYANDGTNFNGYATPDTLLYDSGEFWLGPGTTPRSVLVYNELDFGVYAVYPLVTALPTNFTWTVQFSGLGETDRVGVDLFSPAVNGQSYGDYWWRTNGGGWELRAGETLEMDFAAVAKASTNPVVISVVSTVTNALGSNSFMVTRTWRATDACGNFSEDSQAVTIADTLPPVVVAGATNLTILTETNCLTEIPDLTGQLVLTDCSPITIIQSPPMGTILGVGNHPYSFTIRDAASNSIVSGATLNIAPPVGAETNLSISEFMAKNTVTVTDEDGTFSDWIEIRNAGDCPVNLNDWALTDNALLLTKWRFPATNIAPGQYLVVWASDKNRRTPGAPLHANFKLSDEGEYLALVRPDGLTIAAHFSPLFPPQITDVAYGRSSDWSTNSYLAWATPGATNSPGTNFVVEQLTFSPARGWFTNPVSVTITSSTPGVAIYWTTNGTLPTPSNGLAYSTPLVFSNTTVLRAVGYRTGYAPTASDGHTYVFPELVANQDGASFPTNWGFMTNGLNQVVPVPAVYAMSSNILNSTQASNQFHAGLLSLPTLSVVMNPNDFFGSTNGIYANSFASGSAWERPCSVEYFGPDSPTGFQINCGIRLQGSVSRDPAETPKHKLRLLFKQNYGAPFLVYDLFEGSPVNEFATLPLNAVFQDHWIYSGATAQMQRDQWCIDTQNEISGLGPHGRYANVYINGLYWGIYWMGERPDASYAAHYFGGNKSAYDAINGPDELDDGSWDAFNTMVAIATAGITNEVAYSNLTQHLNIPHFIDYMLMNFYVANQDWPLGNWRAVAGLSRGVPFHFFTWDAEVSFYGTNWDSTGVASGTPGLLYNALGQYAEFRQLFGDRAQRLLFNDGALTPERCEERWMRRAQEIDAAIFSETARWGDIGRGVFTKTNWLNQQASLLSEWFPHRTAILIDQLRTRGMYPSVVAPVLSPHGGYIPISLTVTMSAPAGTIYYTTNGSDPRLPGGAVSSEALVYSAGLLLTNSTSLRARAYNASTWSALVEADYQLATVVDLQLRNIARESDGDVAMEFPAQAGNSYTLSVSTNLIHWAALTNVTAVETGPFTFVDETAREMPARFYRLSTP